MITTEQITTLKCDGPKCKTKSSGTRRIIELWELAQRWGWQERDGKHLCPICIARETIKAEQDKGGAARLIAAAPDLLAACEAACKLESEIYQEAWYASSFCANILKQVHAAIAKAKGAA